MGFMGRCEQVLGTAVEGRVEERGGGAAVRAAGPAVLRIHFVRNFHFVHDDEKKGRKGTLRTASLERTTQGDAGNDEWT